MITGGVAVLEENEYNIPIHFPLSFWIPLILGVMLMLYSFMADAIHLFPATTAELNDLRPTKFNWLAFLIELALASAAVLQLITGHKKNLT